MPVKPQEEPEAEKPAPGGQGGPPAKNSVIQAGCETADLDLVVYGPGGIRLLRNLLDKQTGKRTLEMVPQTPEFEAMTEVLAAAVADLDHEGDLDLAVSSKAGVSLWANREKFTFGDISDRSALPPAEFQAAAIVPVDWDRDVAIDLLLIDAGGQKTGRLENILHGRFRWQPFAPEFARSAPQSKPAAQTEPAAQAREVSNIAALAVAELDGNASWDILTTGPNVITAIRTMTPEPGVVRPLASETVAETPTTHLKLWDYDNDCYQDIVARGANGLAVYRGGPHGKFAPAANIFGDSPPQDARGFDVGDVDGDGDLDLLTFTADSLTFYTNDGGNQHHWIDIALSAETEPKFPSQRSNLYGVGSLVEVKAGMAYQAQVVTRQSTHFGLGQTQRPELVRVLWPNGIPQNEIKPEKNATICQQQRLLKGSCPYLYTWTGSKYEFFTDLLWAAPIGLQFAEGVLAPSRAWEYLKIPGNRLAPHKGEYRLQITEELWEAGYFDTVQLLAVDHPPDVEIFSNEKVGPAELAEFKIHTVRHRRVPVAARDHRGRDVLPEIAREDDVFLKAYETRRKQGLTEPHFLELDLGPLEKPKRITLFLTGWVFPTDTSINIALSQTTEAEPNEVAEFPRIRAVAEQTPELGGVRLRPPSVWVPDAGGEWRETVAYMGFPGGKTKTIAVDLSQSFLTNDYRLRIATTMEICWDAAFFTVDEEPARTNVLPAPLIAADLHYRGFSRRMEHKQFGPESYDYENVTTAPRWPPMAGRFTRFGDVMELVSAADDRLVVLGAGDELTLRFRVPDEPPPAGWVRDFIIHNVGWDKDADLHTIYGQTVEPLPFRAMRGYPYPLEQSYPDTPAQRAYVRDYQTRTQDPSRFWRSLHR
jgi:hypothetical protein